MIWFNKDDDNFFAGNEKHIQLEMEFTELYEGDKVVKVFLSHVSEYYFDGKIKRSTIYTESGEIKSEYRFDKLPPNKFFFTSDFVFDENNKLLSTITLFNDNHYSVKKHLYDEHNKLVGFLRFNNNGEISLSSITKLKSKNASLERIINSNGDSTKTYTMTIRSNIFEKITINEKNDELDSIRYYKTDNINNRNEIFTLNCYKDKDLFIHELFDKSEKASIIDQYENNMLNKREVTIYTDNNYRESIIKLYENVNGKLTLRKTRYIKCEYYED